MLIGDVEIFEKLGKRLLDPFIFGVWKIEELHEESLKVGIQLLFSCWLAIQL